ncbi:glycosyltransferase family 4 protein [Pseudobacter ginsenosidimutans]|uniref:Glycosyltransferase involved in cell wall biosynthesis n=1 Tax=Pseudobacter ginsenosidimutans TaxID=661488 RepID=A0A4Q7MU82_9BACT|nr:glycosyltransferase family 4 protein [Pseudobacter ginsenosidimutans]QEC41042.1 glycosyltransferase family 4 protein [Pseudobacter ginsenosidimutans]RZS72207.1 glycosyltransferase involved in cell wall biosynthesis [Pseudobacter ginsenosidimutans]
MKRILFLSHDNFLHGASRSMIDIASRFQQQGCASVQVIIPGKGIIETVLEKEKIEYRSVWYPLMVHRKGTSVYKQIKKFLSAIKYLPRLRKQVQEFSPDLLYVNSVTNYWGLIVGKRLKIPTVLHIREFGELDHGYYFDLHGLLFHRFKKIPALIICNSQAVSDYFKKRFGVKSIVIPNAIYSRAQYDQHFQERARVRENHVDDQFTAIGIVGNIRVQKGQFDVVKAFHRILERYPKSKLYLIGDGDTTQIRKYIQENQLEKVIEITGFVTNVSDYYQQLDIVVMNSDFEAFGRTTIEAASYGIPVVGKNGGGTPEIITHLETGILYSGQIDELTDNLTKLIGDKGLRDRLGKKAWETAREKFSLETHIDAMRKVLIDQ